MPMTAKGKIFHVQLGRRIAESRKAADITQVELAKTLGIAQQTMAHYEGGVSRIAVALLPVLGRTPRRSGPCGSPPGPGCYTSRSRCRRRRWYG